MILYIIIAIIAISVLILLFCLYQNNKLDVSNYEIKTNSINSNKIKIAHLSDFHSKPAENVIRELEKQKPDLICITGDYINDHCKNKDKMLEYGKRLCDISKVFYITGNHERRLDNFESLMNELKEIGFNVLRNEIAQTNEFAILGLDENQAGFEDYKARREGRFVYKDMSGLFKKLEECDKFRLVLCHFPENFMAIDEVNYSQYDFDLQLSGHAHGGQWIMPFVGPLFSPGQGVFPKYARGSFGDRPKLIVSRGIGNAEFPLRLFNHPELVIINVTK